MTKPRIYLMAFAKIYPLYIAKAEKKGRTKAEVDAIIHWLTGYDEAGVQSAISDETSLEDFFNAAPVPNTNRVLIKGVVCGVRVEDIVEPVMRDIRYMDKLVDELARGKAVEKILRQP